MEFDVIEIRELPYEVLAHELPICDCRLVHASRVQSKQLTTGFRNTQSNKESADGIRSNSDSRSGN